MHDENKNMPYLDSLSLLRDALLPNLLNDGEENILYWAGKELARSQSFESLDDLIQQMNRLFSGELALYRKTKKSRYYEWSGALTSHRLALDTKVTFSLEAGFLAEGYQKITGNETEATYTLHPKKSIVTFLLQSDSPIN
ncbi:MAG: DUF2507 domain-containing protein [Alkalibacterium gilvum]|uniref:DUF2507 domain-containing protein n=1 Tax=Alkalibacterium gilvum TaxID=1130080 RepID=A0A1H6RG72_9LACT|nr:MULTISPECIES: DUF2507 domain-containing protein [Alkalibacterium]MDN6293473.1 YslB family protein [Alkalibacterium sp.]MDN6295184.1 YslB family protein [Alkalibacterium sp.]MDN6728927.1 YslB family protein [Alkalibacterium sp.]SEI52314.1 Protein of unknown function [Alkalibacterium gilvum]